MKSEKKRRASRLVYRLYAGFCLIVLLTVALVVVFNGSFQTAVRTSEFALRTYQTLNKIDAIQQSILAIESSHRAYLLTKQASFQGEYQNRARQIVEEVEDLREELSADQRFESLVQTVSAGLQQWNRDLLEVTARQAQLGQALPAQALADGKAAVDQIFGVLLQMETLILDDAENLAQTIRERAQRIGLILVLSLVVIALASAVVALVLGRNIARPLRALVDFSTKMAEGDLTVHIKASKRKDEVGALGNAFREMGAALARILTQLRRTVSEGREISEQLAANVSENSASVEQLSRGMDQLAVRFAQLDESIRSTSEAAQELDALSDEVTAMTGQQSSAVEQSSAAIEELVASISQLTRVAQEKQQSAGQLTAIAMRGEVELDGLVSSIETVGKSIQLIDDLVGVINNVASQTNLLAMNAAIEAAHAGEQGRGFAVVAEEIRKLAETTAQNSQDITSTVQEIVERISQATTASRETGQSMHSLLKGVESIASGVREMTGGLEEMNKGTDEITGGLGELVGLSQRLGEIGRTVRELTRGLKDRMREAAQVSQEGTAGLAENASGAEQMSTALKSMQELGTRNAGMVRGLEEEISQFKLDGGE